MKTKIKKDPENEGMFITHHEKAINSDGKMVKDIYDVGSGDEVFISFITRMKQSVSKRNNL